MKRRQPDEPAAVREAGALIDYLARRGFDDSCTAKVFAVALGITVARQFRYRRDAAGTFEELSAVTTAAALHTRPSWKRQR
jgi:hypothetical protein